ncbi:hypothetical protein MVEN_00134700 [Mycena venus]|uniref:Glutathione S-transferase n=1 Tax=Mycena venus TaxID=2733690 RepID=A0A8H7DCS7_9AGAR|nr:hypothetical protein MVEN_00134700 [Mycena venus]
MAGPNGCHNSDGASVFHNAQTGLATIELKESDEDGVILYETRATRRYIAAKQLMNWDAYATKIVYEAVVKPKYGWPHNMAEVARLLELLDKKLDAYGTLTLADLFHIPIAPRMAGGGIDIMTRKPNVAKWYKELITRPSWLAYSDGVKTTTSY